MAKCFGGSPLLAPRKKFETLKKNEGCQSVDKGGGIWIFCFRRLIITFFGVYSNMAEKRIFLIFVDSFLNFCKAGEQKLRSLGQFSKFLHIYFLHGASLCGFHIGYHYNLTWNDWDMAKIRSTGVFAPHLDRVKSSHVISGTCLYMATHLSSFIGCWWRTETFIEIWGSAPNIQRCIFIWESIPSISIYKIEFGSETDIGICYSGLWPNHKMVRGC